MEYKNVDWIQLAEQNNGVCRRQRISGPSVWLCQVGVAGGQPK
jgi:hypothetical protein